MLFYSLTSAGHIRPRRGTLIFSPYVGLGQAFTPKKFQEYQAPKKIFERGSSKSAHAWISIIFCLLNTYNITATKLKLFHSSKAVRPQGCTLMYTLFVLIYDLFNISLKSLTLLPATFFE